MKFIKTILASLLLLSALYGEIPLKGNLEDRDVESYMDISSVEALNWIFNPQDKVSKGTLAAFDKYL